MIVYVYPKSTLKSAKHSSILTHLEIHTLSSYTFSAYAWTQNPLQVISCQAFEGFITRTAVSRACHPAQENLYFRHRFWYLIRSSHLCFGSDALTWRAQYLEECLNVWRTNLGFLGETHLREKIHLCTVFHNHFSLCRCRVYFHPNNPKRRKSSLHDISV